MASAVPPRLREPSGGGSPRRVPTTPLSMMSPPRSPPRAAMAAATGASSPGPGFKPGGAAGDATVDAGAVPASFDADSKIVYEGYLMKLKQTSHWVQHYKWNKRWFQIRDGFLLYFKRRGQRQPAGWLRVAQIRSLRALDPAQTLPGTNRSGDNCFQIALTSRTLLLRARSRDEAHTWMRHLTDSISAATPGKGKLTGAGASAIKASAAGNPSSTPVATKGASTPVPVGSPARDAPLHAPPSVLRSAGRNIVPDTAPPASPARWSGDPAYEWVEYWDETSQHPYYVNTRTNESAWVIPATEGAVPRASDLAAREAAAAAARASAEAEAAAFSADQAAAAALLAEKEAADKAKAANAARDAALSAARAAEAEAAADAKAAEDAKVAEASPKPAESKETEDAAGWIKCFDYDFDCEYFYNTVTGDATYDRPDALPQTARYSEAPAEATAPGAVVASESKDGAGEWTAGWTEYWTAGEEPTGASSGGDGAGTPAETKNAGDSPDGKAPEGEEDEELFTECWDTTYQMPYYVSSRTHEATWDRPADENKIVPYHEDTAHEWAEAGVEGAGTGVTLDFADTEGGGPMYE